MKKVIILEHDGGELANQLWNFASIYAYCLERGYTCENWSFFEYAKYFAHLVPQSGLLYAVFFAPFRSYRGRRSAPLPRFFRMLYKVCVVLPMRALCAGRVVYSRASSGVYLLPPSTNAPEPLARQEAMSGTMFFSYVSGGMFRNPVGMEKHCDAIKKHFAPAEHVVAQAHALVAPLRAKHAVVLGVHIRQGDYKVFKGGRYLVPQLRVREIVDEYLHEHSLLPINVGILITSDGPVDIKIFEGLDVVVSKEPPVVDLFSLALCSAVIGSHSTFGNFAAWWGNVPHVVMQQGPMDWSYYADEASYFDNKYFEMVIR